MAERAARTVVFAMVIGKQYPPQRRVFLTVRFWPC
jgi:hypothetical protein